MHSNAIPALLLLSLQKDRNFIIQVMAQKLQNIVQNDIAGCPEEQCERTHCFAGNASFCQPHAFEIWSLDHLCQPAANLPFVFYLVKFLIITKQDFVLKYHILQFYLHC